MTGVVGMLKIKLILKTTGKLVIYWKTMVNSFVN